LESHFHFSEDIFPCLISTCQIGKLIGELWHNGVSYPGHRAPERRTGRGFMLFSCCWGLYLGFHDPRRMRSSFFRKCALGWGGM
jgi:hypothetical protein